VLLTTALADEDPGALLLELYSVECGFFPVTGITNLCFHPYTQMRERSNSFKKSEEI
jgi:hypothetical protein